MPALGAERIRVSTDEAYGEGGDNDEYFLTKKRGGVILSSPLAFMIIIHDRHPSHPYNVPPPQVAVTGGADCTVRLWDARTGNSVRNLIVEGKEVLCVRPWPVDPGRCAIGYDSCPFSSLARHQNRPQLVSARSPSRCARTKPSIGVMYRQTERFHRSRAITPPKTPDFLCFA